MAMHMVMHIMPCVAVSPCAHAGPQGHGHASPGGFTGKPVTICLGRARALHRHWRWHWALAEDIGIIHQHRCCSPAASTDMAVVRRPKHWKQIRSKQPMGVLAVLFPVKLQGPLSSTRSSQYTVSTVPCYSTNNARLLCPGINMVPTPHYTPHATHHTPLPPSAELPSTVTSTTPPCTLSCTPYHPLCSGAGGGGRVGSIRYAIPWYCPHHSILLHSYVYVQDRMGPPQLPTFCI